MIIVTGVGRSGTTLMIAYLSKLGLKTVLDKEKGTNYYEKFRAGLEDPQSIVINQSFLKHYHQERPLHHVDFHADKIKEVDCDALKDPWFVSRPDIIEHWWNARKDIQIIYMWRDYDDIAESQLRVPTMNTPVYRCFPHLMRKVEKEFLFKVSELEIPHMIVRYDDIHPEDISKKLKEWGYDVRKNAKVLWETVWNPR